MGFRNKITTSLLFKSNFNIYTLVKLFIITLLATPTSVFASNNYKVLDDTRGLLSSQTLLSSKKLKSFSSRQGIAVQGKTVQDQVDSFLKLYGKDFSNTSSPKNFKLLQEIKTDHMGFANARYQQSIADIKVTGSYINISLKNDSVRSVFSSLVTDIPSDLKLSPTLTKGRAEAIARNIIGKHKRREMNSAKNSEPVLELFNWEVLGQTAKSSQTKLVWYIEFTDHGLREQIWIDAHSGKLINIVNNIHSARNREVYDSEDTNAFQNLLVRSEDQAPTGDTDTDAAYDFSGDAYDYFFNQHALDSLDGQGATIISNVHFCDFFGCPLFNAFWDGFQLTYGEGFAVDDVVAHELTHGIIEHSADLIYQNQSGALNESYADIFGETVDLRNNAGDDSAPQRWFVGEDVPVFGAIRSMSNPGIFGDPETVSDINFFCGGISFDNGGVHINSGVPNKAYSLMVDGGTFNGFTVDGIGLVKAGKIQYRNLSTYLGESSTFLDNYNGLILSCNDLVGSSGITTDDCNQVEAALNAVEMNSPVCPFEPVKLAEFCPDGSTHSPYISEDFENINAGNLTTTILSELNLWDGCQGSPDVYCDNDPNSGNYNLSGRDTDMVSDSVITLPPFVVQPNSFLSFDHKYDFEPSFDGGVVEYSIDNGVTWVDALTLYNNGLNYNVTISTFDENPLNGRAAFSGIVQNDEEGYLRTVLDLSTLTEETVHFRFRIGTDQIVGGFNGWRIDDISAYQCPSNLGGDILDFLPAILKAAKKNKN